MSSLIAPALHGLYGAKLFSFEGGGRLHNSPLVESEASSTLRKVQFKMASGKLIQLQIDTDGDVTSVVERLCTLSGLSNPRAFDLMYYAMPSLASPTQDSPMALRKAGKSGILKGKLKRKSQEPTYASLDDLLGGGEQSDGCQSPQWERRRKEMEVLDKKWAQHSSSTTAEGIRQMDRELPFYKQGFCSAEHILELTNRRQVTTAVLHAKEVVTETDLVVADYERCSKQFTSGAWPCDVQQASRIVALQAHVLYGGDITATKTSLLPKTLNEKLKECLPEHYRKDKSALKLSLQQFTKHSNISLDAARLLYVDCCKQLATYEATFFVVKAPCPNRRAIMPCVLAISTTTIVRLDGKTRQVVEKWPLSEVVNCLVSPAVFGLLFADDSEFTVMTFQADKIQAVLKQHGDLLDAQKKARYAEIPDPDYNTIDSEAAASSTGTSKTAAVPVEGIYDEIPATMAMSRTAVASTGSHTPAVSQCDVAVNRTSGISISSNNNDNDATVTSDDEMKYDYIRTLSPEQVLTHTMILHTGKTGASRGDNIESSDGTGQYFGLEVKGANDNDNHGDGDSDDGYEVRRNESVDTPPPTLPVTTDSDDGYEVRRNEIVVTTPPPPSLTTSPPLSLVAASVGVGAAKTAGKSTCTRGTDVIDGETHDGDEYLVVTEGDDRQDESLYYVRPDEWTAQPNAVTKATATATPLVATVTATKATATPPLPAAKPAAPAAMVKLVAPAVLARTKGTSLPNSPSTCRPRPKSKVLPSHEVTMTTPAPRTVYTMLEIQTSTGSSHSCPGTPLMSHDQHHQRRYDNNTCSSSSVPHHNSSSNITTPAAGAAIAPPPCRANGSAPLWATPATSATTATSLTSMNSDSPKATPRRRPVPPPRTCYDDVIPTRSGEGMKMRIAPQPADMPVMSCHDDTRRDNATDQLQQVQQRREQLQKQLSTTNPFYTS